MLTQRRRLLAALIPGMAVGVVLVLVLMNGSHLAQSGGRPPAVSSPPNRAIKFPDPRTVGTPYSSAAESSAAAGHTVPTCTDQAMFYNMPDGSVIGYFKSSDAMLSAPVPESYVAGPIQGNAVVKAQTLTVKGLPAWGFQNDRGLVRDEAAGTTIGSTVRSLLTWNEGSTALELTSPSQLSLGDLVSIASSCS